MTLTLEQLLRVPHVDSGYGFDVSPDGRRIAFSWNKSGAWELYEMQLDGAEQAERIISQPPGGKFHPRYSPDGTQIAYALDLDGSESFHIALFDSVSGQHKDLSLDISFSHQPNVSWSPDGSQLAVLSDAGGQFALYVLPAEGGLPQLLLSIDHPCWDAHWSPNGEWIAVEVEWHRHDRSIFMVNMSTHAHRQLEQNGEVLNAMEPAWSPDGHTLAFSGDPAGWQQIGLYDIASTAVRWLENGENEETGPAWSPDGKRLVCLHTKGADTALRVHDLSAASSTNYRMEPGVYSQPQFMKDGLSLLFIFDNPRRPADLWRLDLLTGAATQLTHSLPGGLDTSDIPMPEQVWYPSIDGVMVPAILYRPRAKDAPALVNIHGGPNWLYQFTWHPLMGYLAAQGWAVLAPNYRGSEGYGRAWAAANHMRMGEVDTYDCAAGATYLVKEGLADPKRIVVSGRSHGGYLTMTCLTEYPELWAGGSAVVPFMNWFTAHKNSREDLQHWDIENFGDPVENADLWKRRSPFFYLERVQADVQLICGGHDPRCPASESISARDRLREFGRQVELLIYEDEGHGFLKVENVVDHELRRLAFLERVTHLPGA